MKTTNLFFGHGLKLVLAFLVLTVSQSAMAQPGAAEVIAGQGGSAGRLTFQYVGRNIVTSVTGPGAGQSFTVGYYTYIAGVSGPLFSGPGTPRAASAYFTFRSEPYSFSTFPNENTAVRTVSPGFLIKLYYNQAPDQDFDDADTFSDGQLIATFKVVTSQAIRVDNTAVQEASLELLSSRPFRFGGKIYMIRAIVPHGVTLMSTGTAVSVDADYTSFAYSGSAIAY